MSHTTLFHAQRRLMRFGVVRRMFFESIGVLLMRGRSIAQAAADSTGMESGSISPYFVRRRDRSSKQPTTSHYTRFPKLHLIVDCATHLVLAAHPRRGPTPDVGQLASLLQQLPARLKIQRMYLDAGYDSEPNHRRLREQHRIRSYIPPRAGRPTHKLPSGPWRRLMKRLFRHPARIGHALRGKRFHSHNRQMLLAAVTHNVMILRRRSRGSQPSRSGVELNLRMTRALLDK
jgi:Transposase DDE domain